MVRRTRAGQAGQAGVEAVGLAVVVALVLAAVAAWAVRTVHPPDAAPVGPQALAALLEGAPPAVAQVTALPRVSLEVLRSGTGESLVRRIAGGVRDVVVLGGPAAARGAWDRLRSRARDVVVDPLGSLREALRVISDPPVVSPVRIIVRNAGRLVDYAREIRGLPRDEAIRRVAYDLGAQAADVAVGRLLRVLAGVASRRLAEPPAAPPEGARGEP